LQRKVTEARSFSAVSGPGEVVGDTLFLYKFLYYKHKNGIRKI